MLLFHLPMSLFWLILPFQFRVAISVSVDDVTILVDVSILGDVTISVDVATPADVTDVNDRLP